MSSDVGSSRGNFIQDIINADVALGLNGGRVHTRFPPEPNGWLHIGHAVAICLNHGLAVANCGKFNLRFDDTNPLKEEQEFVNAIIADVKWLGADWEDRLFFASDYFALKYNFAVDLIKNGLAYARSVRAHEAGRICRRNAGAQG
ncbi:MAG: Glutamine--tRNA ligase [Firmicutes bacterium]|nr:Glutamine--tRNA ligase [Bacillota bacterium]